MFILAVIGIATHARAQEDRARDAIAAGLSYLAAHQNVDGSFEATDHKLSATGLSLLAFLSAGNTSDGGRFASNVRRATEFLIRQAPQDRDFGKLEGTGMSGQAIIILALCEAYGVEPEEATRTRLHAILKDAIAILIARPDSDVK